MRDGISVRGTMDVERYLELHRAEKPKSLCSLVLVNNERRSVKSILLDFYTRWVGMSLYATEIVVITFTSAHIKAGSSPQGFHCQHGTLSSLRKF